MSSADTKTTLLKLANQVIQGEHPESPMDTDFARAISNSPKLLKRVSKRKLSDGCELRVFNHPEVDDYLVVVENAIGMFRIDRHSDLDSIGAIYRARTPQEYGFAVINNDGSVQIPISPLWALEEGADSDEAYTVREDEAVWTTPWFKRLFDNHLQTSMEGIFAPHSESITAVDIITVLENAGLSYSDKMEEEELEACDLPLEAGGRYLRQQGGSGLGM
jgi:hypothetical protein